MANIPRLRIPFAPACSAVLGAWLALTPSLLPRSAIIQGALCAVVAMLAYAVGALTGRLLSTLDGAFMVINDEFRTDTPAPTSPHLSAGPASEWITSMWRRPLNAGLSC